MFTTGDGLLKQVDGKTEDGLQTIFTTNLFGHFTLVRQNCDLHSACINFIVTHVFCLLNSFVYRDAVSYSLPMIKVVGFIWIKVNIFQKYFLSS